MSPRTRSLLALAALLPLTAPAAAKPAHSRAPIFQQLVQCRAIKDDAQRLACFDRQAAVIDQAESNNDVVIVDKEQVREAKRSLFGLTLPSFNLFKGRDDTPEITQLDSTIASVGGGGGYWTVRLADGSSWQLAGTEDFFRTPKPGLKVLVKRGALNSYSMRIENSPGVKVRRIN